ncbi:MAG: glycerol dehydrogenase, partial [Firmicutes bacterium]|nr:glycerol dehydrogenase [Bacillota bacterium]
EIDEYLRLSHRIGLPVTLEQLGIKGITDADWHRIARLSLEVEDMAAMPFPVTQEMVIKAIQGADALGRAFLQTQG